MKDRDPKAGDPVPIERRGPSKFHVLKTKAGLSKRKPGKKYRKYMTVEAGRFLGTAIPPGNDGTRGKIVDDHALTGRVIEVDHFGVVAPRPAPQRKNHLFERTYRGLVREVESDRIVVDFKDPVSGDWIEQVYAPDQFGAGPLQVNDAITAHVSIKRAVTEFRERSHRYPRPERVTGTGPVEPRCDGD